MDFYFAHSWIIRYEKLDVDRFFDAVEASQVEVRRTCWRDYEGFIYDEIGVRTQTAEQFAEFVQRLGCRLSQWYPIRKADFMQGIPIKDRATTKFNQQGWVLSFRDSIEFHHQLETTWRDWIVVTTDWRVPIENYGSRGTEAQEAQKMFVWSLAKQLDEYVQSQGFKIVFVNRPPTYPKQLRQQIRRQFLVIPSLSELEQFIQHIPAELQIGSWRQIPKTAVPNLINVNWLYALTHQME